MSKEKFDIYQVVTDKILTALDQDIMPWRKPWSVKNGQGTRHTNFHSKRPYRGINPFLLEVTAVINGWTSPYWLTGKQVKEHGGKVNEDQYFSNDGPGSTLVVFWNRSQYKPKPGYHCKCGGKYNTSLVCDKCGKPAPAKLTSALLRNYNVWNIEQTDLEVPVVETPPEETFNPVEEAERILSEMPDPPKVRYADGGASYMPAFDVIQLPKRVDFHSSEAFYSTSFHEHVHSTGHEKRVNRKKAFGNSFGDPEYAKEELVAEMGASMLCAIAGVENDLGQSTSYIRHWMSKADYEAALKADKKLVVVAAAQAQKAADFICGDYQENGEQS